MRYKSIVYVTPEPIKNMGNFRNYLIDNTESLVTYHFFHGYSDNKSYMEKFEKGKLIKRVEYPTLKLRINLLRIVIHWISLNYILYRYANNGAYVIVEKPFFLVLNTIPSLFKNLKFVFWIGDYYPDESGLMRVYSYLTDYYNRNLRYVLYESPPIKEIYLKRINKKKLENKYRALVTLGMKKELDPVKKSNKILNLGFIGVIRKMQGLDLIFEYLSNSKADTVLLEIIGSGYYFEHYNKLAKNKRITNKVKFYGFVKDLRPIVKNWDIGLALYENRRDNISIYCEPTKIKDYLEFGLPVITTKATYFYKELVNYSVGEVMGETKDSLERAIGKIMINYKKYILGIKKIVDNYEYNNWYERRFKFLEE